MNIKNQTKRNGTPKIELIFFSLPRYQMKLNSVSEASDDLDALMAEAGVNLKSRANPRGASLRAGAIAAQVGAAVKEQENALKRRQVCMIHSFLFLFTSRTMVQNRKNTEKKAIYSFTFPRARE